jgi:hypothetical protein
MNEQPVLIAREGEFMGHQWSLDRPETIIGRGSDADIVLPERQVSRHHIRIVNDNNGYVLHDLGSKNGTYLNGQQVGEPTRLKDGDEIQIALCVKLLFVGTDATLPLSTEVPRGEKKLLLDEAQRTVIIDDTVLDPPLSLAQFRLLKTLYEMDGAVCERDRIVEAVWPGTEGLGVSEQAIDALVRRLRDRLSEADDHNYIVTVRGHGFRMDNPPE